MSESPKKKGVLKPSFGMAALVTLVLIALVFVVSNIDEWAAELKKTGDDTENVASAPQRSAAATRGSIPSVSYEWQRVTLPQGDADWPSWILMPAGHSIQFCDPVNDPGCSARDFRNVRFDAQCRSLADGNPRDQESGECVWTDAYRMRAKGTEPMTLLYRFKPES